MSADFLDVKVLDKSLVKMSTNETYVEGQVFLHHGTLIKLFVVIISALNSQIDQNQIRYIRQV